MNTYQSNPQMAPDSDFEPGNWAHLVVGNQGRMLDARRTPIQIVELRPAIGAWVLKVLAFEDRGAEWELPFEQVSHFQFHKGSPQASRQQADEYAALSARFNRQISVACDPAQSDQSHAEIAQIRLRAAAWLDREATFFKQSRPSLNFETLTGEPLLYQDLQTYLHQKDLWTLDQQFARQYVSHPEAGEIIKSYRLVLADKGLIPYQGPLLRNAALLEGERPQQIWTHICYRLAFVQGVFEKLGLDKVWLYRGLTCAGKPYPTRNQGFVSSSFHSGVAQSHLLMAAEDEVGILYRQAVPSRRLFMTYFETEAMNHPYQEAEALLLFEPDHWPF